MRFMVLCFGFVFPSSTHTASDQLIKYNNNSPAKNVSQDRFFSWIFTGTGFNPACHLLLGGFSRVVFVECVHCITQRYICVILSKVWGELENGRGDVPGQASESPTPSPLVLVGPGHNSIYWDGTGRDTFPLKQDGEGRMEEGRT